jgi:hypothetical protein
MAKRGNTAALTKFRHRVEAIQRHSGISFRAAQKQASRENKGHKAVGKVKRKRSAAPKRRRSSARPRPRAKTVIKTVRVTRTKRIKRIGAVPIKKRMASLRDALARQLGVYEGKRIASTTRKAYNHAAKKVSEIRSQIRRLC